MSSTSSISSIIGRNSSDFNFVEALGSFIGNLEFLLGYRQYLLGKDSKDAFIWHALSCIGEQYALIIYENVLNYLDNASNVDLCKIKALLSLMEVVGVKYDVLRAFNGIPVELANIMDILSINPKYLLDSKTFKLSFIDYLSSVGVIRHKPVEDFLLSSVLSNALSSTVDNDIVVDLSQYSAFLDSVYNDILTSFIYMKYADADAGILDGSANDLCIYEFILNDILAGQLASDYSEQSEYEKSIALLKTQCNISKSFDQEAIVDAIEDGYDSFYNYNTFEQEVLKYEMLRREASYARNKPYDCSNPALGFSLTRYSYYREKKVKQYFKFVEDTFNSLILELNIESTIQSNAPVSILPYVHDINYFDIDLSDKKTLLTREDDELIVLTDLILAIVRLLTLQTLAIADIRDLVKLLIRKSYMRGTFLLISYVINEFLKYNIVEKYGSKFSTDDSGTTLGLILSTSIARGGNVELIEYYDDTEYFNITRDGVDVNAQYSDTVNEKFWDNVYNKIGVNTEDLPLELIDTFYLKQLKLEKKGVDNLVNFLSIIYDYGANNSYISRKTGEYTCLIPGREVGDSPYYIGDPHNEISALENDILSVLKIHDCIDLYIENGYLQGISSTSALINDLCNWASSDYFWNEISVANEDLKDKTLDLLCNDLDSAYAIALSLADISAQYEDMLVNPRYSYYLTDNGSSNRNYKELGKAYFIEKLCNFKLSVEDKLYGINWMFDKLNLSLDDMYDFYTALSSNLYNKLFLLSVWPADAIKVPYSNSGNLYWNNATTYWPYYSPMYENELTTVTTDLKNFLTSLALTLHEEAMQHLLNHYNALLGYKEEINRVLQSCNEADAKLNAFAIGVLSRIGCPNSQDLDFYDEITVYTEHANRVKAVKHTETDDEGLKTVWYEDVITEEDAFWLAETSSCVCPAVDTSSIEAMIDSLIERTNYPKFNASYVLTNVLVETAESDFGPCTSATVVLCMHQEFEYYDDNGIGHNKYWVGDEELYVPTKYKTTSCDGYMPNSAIYPYASDSDADIKNDIMAAFNNAVANLTSNVSLINDELTCLNYSKITFNLTVDIDNVRSSTEEAYGALVNRIDLLTKVIQAGREAGGWLSLVPLDINLTPYANRLKTIDYINDSSSKQYNIRYIETQFNALQLSILNVLADNSDYFEDFVNNLADRLDKLILAMSSYMRSRDSMLSAEVLSTVNSISSLYILQLDEFNNFSLLLNRKEVDSINDNYSYNLSTITYRDEIYNKLADPNLTSTYNGGAHPPWPIRCIECLDYLLSGDYINQSWGDKLSGVIYWLDKSQEWLEDSITSNINAKIPTLTAYIELTNVLDTAKNKYADKVEDEDLLLTLKLDLIVENFLADIQYISSCIPFYEASHEIYLKYNGTDIGYDPFYCYKNMAYSSYLIHPYLYNFVEKSNVLYPLANNFFVSFGDYYERDLYEKGIDSILGRYGNVKDIWKSGMFDWTSYLSKYERQGDLANFNEGSLNPNNGFTGLFYPPAVKALLADKDTFVQDVQDDASSSYYHHLNLTDNECLRIYEQLLAYFPMISCVATAQGTGRLSGEFDIYKYAEDCMGNSLFLLKSYLHLYEQHKDDPSYTPSYHEKRNTPGELWMRVKDHPLAFPAFDLRKGYEDLSQYSIVSAANSLAKPINDYIPTLNKYFLSHEDDSGSMLSTAIVTRDTIGQYEISGADLEQYDRKLPKDAQHLRCIYDFELDPQQVSLLLVVPFRTGSGVESTYGEEYRDLHLAILNMRFADSSIVIGYLGDHALFNATSNLIHVYNFTVDTYSSNYANIDNILNKHMLVNGLLKYSILTTLDTSGNYASLMVDTSYFTEFIGFAKTTLHVYALFVRKYTPIGDGNSTPFTFVYGGYRKNAPQLTIEYARYKKHMTPVYSVASSRELLYDVYDYSKDDNQSKSLALNDYRNASNVAMCYGDGEVTIGYVTARLLKASDNAASAYLGNSKIVNFVEYSAQVEDYNAVSAAGSNLTWPRSTAFILTTDSQHINIYNSFDSFVQDLVNVHFTFVGQSLVYSSTDYFNLNSDLGYLPQYVDVQGTSHYGSNTALRRAQQYSIELLGPEKSDIEFTPVILTTEDDKYGRVVEGYRDINKISAFNDDAMTIRSNEKTVSCVFDLKTIYVNEMLSSYGMSPTRAEQSWNDLLETQELLSYKYIIYNTNYLALPILKGNLSDILPNGCYYQGAELYDMLSGEEVIGPNLTTYLNIDMTNHIDNISAITAHVEFDVDGTSLPSALVLSCIAREKDPLDRDIAPHAFFMLMYLKNNLQSYKYHHLFENANKNISYLVPQEFEWSLDLSKTSTDLSGISFTDSNGITRYPFKSINDGKYDKLSAGLEFKYSEEDPINREFPNIDPIDIEDEITIVENDSLSIYYFSIDDYSALDLKVFNLLAYEPGWVTGSLVGHRYNVKINPMLPKYRDFYSRALVIEATYNMEKKLDDETKYEVVLYFNYKNFTNPQYVNIDWDDNLTAPPSAYVCDSTDESLENTYLVLRPGQSGRLDIRVDFVEYLKLDKNAINLSIVGALSLYLKSYYIMNVSDEKPKFIISRKPFGADEGVEETGNYELEDLYYPGMAFLYAMMVINLTRTSEESSSPLHNYVAMSLLTFNMQNTEKFEYPAGTEVTMSDGAGASIVYPNVPENLLVDDPDKEFFASNLSLAAGNHLSIMIDLKKPALDITVYNQWSWYNSHCSNSHVGYIPKSFMMLFSNDKQRWYKVNLFNDVKNSITTVNYAKAYTGELKINEA